MSKRHWRVLALSALLVTGVGVGFGLRAGATQLTPEQAVQAYLDAMARSDFDTLMEMVNDSPGCNPAGFSGQRGILGPFPAPEVSIQIPGPKQPALWPATLRNQRALVINLFGPDAWRQASFRLEPGRSRDSSAVWVDSEGRRISAEEAQAQMVAFWKQIEETENVDLSILSSFGRLYEQASEAERPALLELYKQVSLIRNKYIGKEPVHMEFVDKYLTFKVRFTFGPESDDQCHGFMMYLCNQTGRWTFYGFQWHWPVVPDEGDI